MVRDDRFQDATGVGMVGLGNRARGVVMRLTGRRKLVCQKRSTHYAPDTQSGPWASGRWWQVRSGTVQIELFSKTSFPPLSGLQCRPAAVVF